MKKMPVRIAEITLDGDYEGWTFSARLNFPCGLLDDFSANDPSRLMSAAGQLIKNWNFVDEEGNPLPQPSAESIRLLPIDLLNKMLTAVVTEAQKLPPQSSRPS